MLMALESAQDLGFRDRPSLPSCCHILISRRSWSRRGDGKRTMLNIFNGADGLPAGKPPEFGRKQSDQFWD